MSILTEKEREDVYKYWLKSTTLTDEDGLIQITERAVLERVQAEILRKNEIMREAHRMLDAIFRHGVNGTFVTEHEAIIEKLSKELNK